MSGSSLDGLDVVHCLFDIVHIPEFKILNWQITHAETITFDDEILKKLNEAVDYSGRNLVQFDHELGKVFGNMTANFIKRNNLSPDFISSHGHTVFHATQLGFTLQIGHPAEIVATTELPVVGDFRSTDIALKGQGAPFAPIVDHWLFSDYDILVNLGGIMNITFLNTPDGVIAYDIGPCNQTLNYLASLTGAEYDKDGTMAAAGKTDDNLLQKLKAWPYFELPIPKSLDNSHIKTNFHNIIDNHTATVQNKLATMTELIAFKLAETVNSNKYDSIPRIMLAGGGAFNNYLVSRMKHYSGDAEMILPDKSVISYKEGLLLALMGLLRIHNIPNVLKSVTGSKTDHIAGAVYQGIKKQIHEQYR